MILDDFSSLGEYQKLDFIRFFFERESARTAQNPRPKYRFPLERFRDYFGQNPEKIRVYVLNSEEYKAYAFSLLDEFQKRDLILYFYERDLARTEQNPQPPYTFSLERFRGYFGRSPAEIRNTVLHSDECKAYAEERSRPPAPPEMPRVDKRAELDRSSQVDEASAAGTFDRAAILSSPAAAGTKRAAPDPDPDDAGAPGALSGADARARNCDVAGEALSRGASTGEALSSGASTTQSPQWEGEPLPPLIALRPQCKRQLMRQILGAGVAHPPGNQPLPVIFLTISEGAVCRDEILGSDPDLQGSVDWNLEETLGKVRASHEDVITKDKYRHYRIIYSEDGKFPVLDVHGQPPAGLEWQKTALHGLVISGKNMLIKAVEGVIGSSRAFDNTFQDANKEVQETANEEVEQTTYKRRKYHSVAQKWKARTALFLIRLFSTAIG